jgi:hypothetical protein
MQIIELTIGGALSQLASQQEASQEYCYRGRLFTTYLACMGVPLMVFSLYVVISNVKLDKV